MSIEEVWSAAFKHSNRQMFQFPTWRTGSAHVKGTKCLFRVVTTLRFLLPPPTLNLLPWSWTVWIRTVRAALWPVSWKPLACKIRGRSLRSRALQFPPSIFVTLTEVPIHRAKKLGQLVCTVQREETKVCVWFCLVFFYFNLLLSLSGVILVYF